MRRSTPLILAGLAGVSLFGGCPAPVIVDTIQGAAVPATPSVSTQAPSANEVVAGGGSLRSGGGTSPQAADTLARRFPGCSPALLEAEWKARIIELVNQERAAEGLNPVTLNQTLEAQATQYACEMIAYQFFDHVNPVTQSTLADRADQFGYDFFFIGENLAAGQGSPEEAMRDWMNSPGHRANILEPRFVELGVGVRTGGDYGTYWVQEFGEP
ncbi:MAG: CAP domain-containing protein, partial [Phycisphaerales bacterium]|nr:CAP domain-containing protein [Phycisphaerales bacterium]